MPPTGPDSSDGPDVFEALRGMAHLSDYARKLMGESDPQLRKQVEMLGDANVKDVVEAVGTQLNAETPTPHLDMRDTDYGLDVLVDCSETPVNPSNLTTVYDGTELTLMEPQTGWEASATTDAPIQSVEVIPTDAGLVTIEVRFDGGTGDMERTETNANSSVSPESSSGMETESVHPSSPMTNEHTPTEEPDAQLPDNIAGLLADLDTSKTLNEALDDNPALEDVVTELLGESQFTMVKTLMGETPIEDLPIEEHLPDDMTLPDEIDGLDTDAETPAGDADETADEGEWTMDGRTDFDFDADPLSDADDE